MRFLLILASIALCFPLHSSAATEYYACFDGVSTPNEAYVACRADGYYLATPEQAANAYIGKMRAWLMKQHGSSFLSYTTSEVVCDPPKMPFYYLNICRFNATLKIFENGKPKTVFENAADFAWVSRPFNCGVADVFKGSVGSVVTNSKDGSRFVLSKNPGETVCSNSCSYSFKSTDKCYLSVASETEGFCNYKYSLAFDDKKHEISCTTDPSLQPAEVGDELTDKCLDGYQFAEGTRQCVLTPCPEGQQREEGSEQCTAIPDSGSGNPGGSDGSSGSGSSDGSGGDNGSTGGSGGGSGTDPGTGGGGTGSGTGSGGDPGGSNGGSGGDQAGEDGSGAGHFDTPGPLDLSSSVNGKEAEFRSQFVDMKDKYQSTQLYHSASTAFSSLGHSSAACPTANFELFGKPIEISSHCVLLETVAPILNLVFTALWLLIAARVVLSA